MKIKWIIYSKAIMMVLIVSCCKEEEPTQLEKNIVTKKMIIQ